MWPMKWTALLIAPVSALFLTACPENKNNEKSEISAYTGAWINAELDSAYRTHQRNLAGFCQALSEDFQRYGIGTENGRRYRLVVDAWLINHRGEVMVYKPMYRANDASYRYGYYKGYLDSNGFFTRRDLRANPAFAYDDQNQGPYYFWYSNARVMKNGETLTVYGNQRPRQYVRADEKLMLTIYAKVDRCFGREEARRAGPPIPPEDK